MCDIPEIMTVNNSKKGGSQFCQPKKGALVHFWLTFAEKLYNKLEYPNIIL